MLHHRATKDNINLELLLVLNETLSMYFIVNSKYLPLQKSNFGEYIYDDDGGLFSFKCCCYSFVFNSILSQVREAADILVVGGENIVPCIMLHIALFTTECVSVFVRVRVCYSIALLAVLCNIQFLFICELPCMFCIYEERKPRQLVK